MNPFKIGITRKERRKRARKNKKQKRFLNGARKTFLFNSKTKTATKKIKPAKIKPERTFDAGVTNLKTNLPDLDSVCKFADDIINPKKSKAISSTINTNVSSPQSTKNSQKQSLLNPIKTNNQNSTKIEKYIPKFRLHQMEAETESFEITIQSVFNKLSATNIEALSKDIISLYGDYSNNEINESIMKHAKNALYIATGFSDNLAIYIAALLTAVHIERLELYFGVFFVEQMVMDFVENYKRRDSPKAQKMLALIAYSYCFQMAHVILIRDLLLFLSEDASEFGLELLYAFLHKSGSRLRKEQPILFREFFQKFQKSSPSSTEETGATKTRLGFLQGFITDLKTNKNLAEQSEVSRLRKWVATLVNKKNVSHYGKRVVCVGLKDFLCENKTGRWWLDCQLKNIPMLNKHCSEESGNHPLLKEDPAILKKLEEKAEKLGFKTRRRAIVFCLVFSSQNAAESLAKLQKLFNSPLPKNAEEDSNVKGPNGLERDVAFVLFACSQREQTFNSFYCALIKSFLAFRRGFRFTLKVLFYGYFNTLSSVSDNDDLSKSEPYQIRNTATLLAFLIANETYSLGILSKFPFELSSRRTDLFLATLFNRLLTQCDAKKVAKMYSLVNKDARLGESIQGFHERNREEILGCERNLTDKFDLGRRALN